MPHHLLSHPTLEAKEIISHVREGITEPLRPDPAKESEGPRNESLPLDSLPRMKQFRSAGELLRQSRLKQGLTIKEAAERLEVASKYLEALENDRLSIFSARIYGEGVLMRYAKFIKAPTDEVADAFRLEWGKTRPAQHEGVERPLPLVESSYLVITPKRLSIAGGVVVVLLVVSYFSFQISKLLRPPTLSLSSPAAAAIFYSSEVVLEGQVSDSESRLTMNGKTLLSDAAGHFREVLSLPAGVHTIEVQAENKFGKISSVSRTISVEEINQSLSATSTP